MTTDLQKLILAGLQRKPMYAGTVSFRERANRRAKGRVAKATRKVNRP